jgi:hypothetical protein
MSGLGSKFQAIDGARPDVLITFPAFPAIETEKQVLPGEINQLGYFNKIKQILANHCAFPLSADLTTPNLGVTLFWDKVHPHRRVQTGLCKRIPSCSNKWL